VFLIAAVIFASTECVWATSAIISSNAGTEPLSLY
jgi:hypothetical protein